MKKILVSTILIWLAAIPAIAATRDSLALVRHNRSFFHQVGDVFTRFFREFNNTDSAYIEPQRYNYTVMLQNTNTYESYTLYSKKGGQKITFSPEPSYRLGPYLGWRWVFLGYTFDLKHVSASSDHTNKKELDLSLYSSLLGLDLFWRQTGNSYRIHSLDLGEKVNTEPIRKTDFDGFKASIKGVSFYYIFNHRKFSYPAAYSQSTIQRRSAGSWMVGLGYTQHQLEVDWDKLSRLVADRLGKTQSDKEVAKIDSSLMFSKVEYSDYSATVGYGYNWVICPNLLFNASLSVGLAYNQSSSDSGDNKFNFRNFGFKNFNLDGVGRFAIVWNNMKWYVGASTVIHTYNYKQDNFSTNNSFGSVNIYCGVNFGRKK